MHQFNFLFSPAADALGLALLFSIGQAFIIFLSLHLVLKFIPNVSSHIKYSLAYCSYLAIGAWFFITLIRQCSIAQNEALIQPLAGANLLNPVALNAGSHSPSLFSMPFLNSCLPFLVAFYLAGIILYSIWLFINFFRTKGLKTRGLFELDPEWQHHIMNLAKRMNINSVVQTFFSTKIKTPLMIGFIKPVILLPFTAMNHLSAEQFEAIVLHELAHIRRNDYLLNIIQSVLDTVLFFNPFTWWITRYIREEREKSCDEMVLQFSDPYPYARALLSLEEPLAKRPLIMTAAGKRSHLFHRIKNIMEMKNNHLNLRQKFITSLVIAVAIISVSWLSPEKNSATYFNDAPGNSGAITPRAPQSPAIFTFFNFNTYSDTLIPKVPPAPLAAPMPSVPPVAIVTDEASGFPVPPVPPTPPAPPIPPVPLHGVIDSLPFPADYFNSKEWKQQQEAIKKSTEEMHKYFQSDAWKKQQDLVKENATAMKKYFNSPEWKKQQDLIKKNGEELKKYFNSPEWKKQQELMKKNGKEIKKYFNSPEWKHQQELIKKNAEKMKEYFNSPEWKKQQELMKKNGEKMKKYFNSPEWKKQQEQIRHATDSLSTYFNNDAMNQLQVNVQVQRALAVTQKYFQNDALQNVQKNLENLMIDLKNRYNEDELKK